MKHPALWRAAAAGLALAAALGTAPAESLHEALAIAYGSNPTINSERARQRATDENVPQALAGWRPTIVSQSELARSVSDRDSKPSPGIFSGQSNARIDRVPASFVVQLTQPVFQGFRTVESTKAAVAQVKAGREQLIVTEQQVLFAGVQSYMDTIRDRQIVQLRARNVSFLERQLSATQERFAAGEVTRTDVEQARARLSLGLSQLAVAKGNLATSISNYVEIFGRQPGTLNFPRPVKLFRSLEAAFAAAGEENPNILVAAYVEDVASHQIEVARADLLPELNLQLRGQQSFNDIDDDDNVQNQEFRVSGILTVPFYEAGRSYSAVRQQKQIASQRRIEVLEAERSVRQGVAQSWAFYVAAGQQISAAKAQVSAAEVALDGVQQEFLVGSRTTLDVLDAQAELVNANILLIAAQRDRVVGAYQILGSVGRLTADYLALAVDLYDPAVHYRQVKHKWIGTRADTIE